MSVGLQSGQNRSEKPSTVQASGPADWDTLKGDVGEIAGAAVEQGRHFLDSARMQAVSYADQRKGAAAQSVADLAKTLRDMMKAFDDRPNIRAVVDSAADGLDQFADSIRSRSYADIYEDVENAMRPRPATVGAAALVTGFFLSRFVKASAANRREAQATPRGRGPGGARAPDGRLPAGSRAARVQG